MTFSTEQEAINWIENNIPFAVKPVSKGAKYQLIYPFRSVNAKKVITEHLGKKLFKLIQK